MSSRTFDCLVPVPEKAVFSDGNFLISGLHAVSFPREADTAFAFLKSFCHVLKISLSESAPEVAGLIFQTDPSAKPEAWQLNISPEKIIVSASGRNGFLYAAGALAQMLTAGMSRGRGKTAYLDCCHAEDAPRFPWRGFMLDSARHFQSAGTVRKLLHLLAAFRINSFHWHLSDNQAWRWETNRVPGLAGKGEIEDGFYTRDELRGIAALSARLGIRIVPEIDVPGHSRRVLSMRPDLACDSAQPGNEFCLGNPESAVFIKGLLAELMEIFPDSPVIHLGGDEAAAAHWEKCPRCQAVLKERNLQTFRQLENEFMNDLNRFVLSKGRTPMMWGTCSGQKYDPGTIMQAWLDIREPLRLAENGNKVVYSVHNSLYFDYPADLSEPHENWMFALPEQGVHMTEPYMVWPDQVKDAILGTEACLWTESVPEWRVVQKILPRLFAYSECAWSLPERKEYNDFVRRRKGLESAGYTGILLQMEN